MAGILRAIPKAICTCLVTWSWFAVVVKGIANTRWSIWAKVILEAIVTVECSMTLGLYWLTVTEGPHFATDLDELRVVDETRVPEILLERALMVKTNGGYRLCTKCNVWKPDRCHHCSSCDRCVLKMDHHCPWFGECVGYGNLRWFIQFLIHSVIYLVIICAISSVIEYQTELGASLHVLFAAVLGAIFFLCVFVLFCLTTWQLVQGRTTIESFESQKYRHSKYRNIFDMGIADNWRIVMGRTACQWFFPVRGPFDPSRGVWYASHDSNLMQRLSNEILR